MTEAQDEVSAPPASSEVAVDPFEFFPGVASKIIGLGGSTPGHDPNYVFHTPYLEAAPGPSRFTVQFHGLTARRGTLWLRVNMLSIEDGARAVLANSDRILLNRLIQNDGRCDIGFEGFRGMSFALYAGVQGDTDAEATGVDVWFDRPADPERVPAAAAEGRNTRFGLEAARSAIHLLSTDRPSLAAPVTQVATAAQLAEPIFADLAAKIPKSADPLTAWQELYVFQALQRYGMLQPGAQGLGIARGASGLAEAIIAADTELTLVSPAEAEGECAHRPIALNMFSPDLLNFDFLWSVGAWDGLASPQAGRGFVEGAMAVLRPGGLAIHCGAYAFRIPAAAPGALGRSDVERLLLLLISRGHEVAQFRIPDTDALSGPDGSTGAIGVIVRKAVSFV